MIIMMVTVMMIKMVDDEDDEDDNDIDKDEDDADGKKGERELMTQHILSEFTFRQINRNLVSMLVHVWRKRERVNRHLYLIYY